MGVFRALIVILVGLVSLSVIENNDYLLKIPLVGQTMTNKIRQNKHYIVVYIIAFVMLIL